MPGSPRRHWVATVCLIGNFPPAAGGQALVNDSFRRLTRDAGADVITIDLSAGRGSAVWRRASRIPKVFWGVFSLLGRIAWREVYSVYIGVAGGYGQLYDTVFVSLTRVAGPHLFLHHDSYAYLETRRPLTAALVRIAGASATHIVLCEDMKNRLTKLYGPALQVVVVSNSTNTEPPTKEASARSRLKTIGFISHLIRSKGVLEFLDVAERVCRAQPDVRALLAGTFEEPALRPIITQRLLGASWITYVGPVYGEAKSRFYADIDAFVFPSRHVDEADPRVIDEALAHGVAVIARARGCISSILEGGGGAVIGHGIDFVSAAERQLLEWHKDPALFSSVSSAALANSGRLRAAHLPRLTAVISALARSPQPPAAPGSPDSRASVDGPPGDGLT